MRMRRDKWFIWLLIIVCAAVWSGVCPAPAAAAGDTIRVKLTRLGSPSSVTMTTVGGYTAEGRSVASGSTVRVQASGSTVSLSVNGVRVAGGSSVALKRSGSGVGCGVRFTSPSLINLFCGDLTFTASGGVITAVLRISVETYLYGVVAYEMADSYPLEALKAQAVAARTVAMKNMKSTGTYDVTDNTSYQVFKGYNSSFANVISAVNATRGVCLTYGGGYITAAYSDSNGGYTMTNTAAWGGTALPYLPAKADPYDLENPASTVRSARIPITPTTADPLSSSLNSALKSALGLSGSSVIAKIVDMVPHTEKSGANTGTYKYIRFTVEAQVSGSVKTLSCDLATYGKLETMFGLSIMSSTPETVAVEKGSGCFYIRFRRWGHGVGLSQCGAQWMAKKYGKSYTEILSFYYPGTRLTSGSAAGSAPEASVDGALSWGMSGEAVKKLQARLKELGYFTGSIGGNYRDLTAAAVSAFQKDHGLEPDGVATAEVQRLIFGAQAAYTPAPKPTSSPTAAPTPTRYRVLRYGDSGTPVKKLQSKLKELGYFKDTVSGQYLEGTRNAVKRYQKAKGIAQDGVASVKLQEMLFAETKATPAPAAQATASPRPAATASPTAAPAAYTPLKRGDSGAEVRKLQKRLKELGYFTGSVTGKYEASTAVALKAFQKKVKLPQTGTADAVTRSLLHSTGAPKSSTAIKDMYVKTGGAELRAEAAESGKKLADIPAGAKVKMLCKVGQWTRVQYNGQAGYVPADRLTAKK